jgi:hypothetical protein
MKIKNFLKFIVVAVSALIFFACEDNVNSGEDNCAIVSLSADGSTSARTTKIFFTVNNDKITLTADDIKINADFSVIKGEIKQTGTMTYELSITPGNKGAIRVGLDPYRGFTGWNAKAAAVYADWYFSGTTELTIKGYSLSSFPSDEIPFEIADLPVTAIGDSAFNRKELTSVIIPSHGGIKVIGERAFAYNQLTEIDIPDSVVSIKSVAFAYNQLSKVTINDNVTSIGSGAFGYNQLTEIYIPKNITDIESSTFAFNQLEEVDIPDGVTAIRSDAFTDNNLSKVTIPASVTFIGNGAFGNNKLTEIELDKLDKLEYLSGFNNNELTEIDIPNTVMIIGSSAFAYNELEEIIISNTVTEIGYRAFAYNKLSEITIVDKVKSIGIQAFIGNPLTSITIGENVALGSSSFGNGFENFYYSNDRKKGTYNRAGDKWTYTVIP